MLPSLSVPHKFQIGDGYCLPACAQMVLAYWGEDRDQRKLARQLQTVAGAGTPGSRLTLLASRQLEITYRSGELLDLQQAIAQGIPPIALVRTADLQYWGDLDFAHAVVIGMDQEFVLLHDPAQTQAPQVVSVGNFYLAWDSMGNLFGLIKRR